MTVITGNVQDIGLSPLSGALVATAVEFRTTGDIVVAPESRSYPIVAGLVSADLLPGPVRLIVQVGSHARESFDVIVPEAGPVTLAFLIEEAVEWSPAVVSQVARLRDDAVAAAERAETAAQDVDAAIAGAADTVVQAVEADRVAAEAAAGTASTAAGEAAGSASAASTSAGAASTSAGGAASSASAASTAAGESADSATAAGLSALDAAGHATTTANDRAQTGLDRAAAHDSAVDAADSATLAGQHASSFGITAEGVTGAPGSGTSVDVSGSGPAYHLTVTTPRGDKGDKGDDGEVSQAALDAAVASLVDNAPEALNTLDELATALGNDPNFATTTSEAIGLRAKTADVDAALLGKADVGAEDTATWVGVSGKPSTFPPESHSHTAADVGARPDSWTPAWSEVTSKPATFPPATHTHTKGEVGLGNVDNTSDAAKPVSTSTQAALDGKEPVAWDGTQAQYDALGSYDPNTTYYVEE